MTKSIFRKGLIFGIIFLFVGEIVAPTVNSHNHINTNESISVSEITNRNVKIIENSKSKFYNDNEIDLSTLEPDGFSLLQEFNNTYIPGELIVKFKKDLTIDFSKNEKKILNTGIKSMDLLNKKYSVTYAEKIFNSITDYPFSNFYKFTLNENADILVAAEEYSKNSYVEYAEPNYIFHTCNVPNDPLYSIQWPLNNIGQDYPSVGRYNTSSGSIDSDIDAPEAWDIETGNSDIVIAIVDTGVDYTHPDLAENMWINKYEDINNNDKFDNWPSWMKKNGLYGDIDKKDNDGNGFIDDIIGWDFSHYLNYKEMLTKGKNDPMDVFGHGTHCAGIVAAVTDNNKGIAGVCWNSKIMAIKVSKGNSLNLMGAIAGIKYAVDNGANIISMSWGGPGVSTIDKILKEFLDYAYMNNVTLVAAAGNLPIDIGVWNFIPACYDNVIAVAATNSKDELASFSSYGLPVDVAAPGVDILSLRAKNTDMYGDGKHIADDNYYLASGTSMACPHVSGVAALILSKKQDLTPMEVKTIICSSADKMNSSNYAGIGRINAHKALQKVYSVIVDINSSLKVEEITGLVKINGSVIGEGFQKYVIEYGKGVYPETWIEIYNSTEEKADDLLAVWDTSDYEDAVYTVRLRAIYNHGIYEDRTMFLVNKICNTFFVNDDGDKDFTDIRSAVNNAGDGDIIYVYNGTYNENVYIYRSINLIGEKKETTIINASESESAIWIILGDGIKISGFTLLGKITSIYLRSSHNNTVTDNKIQDSFFGFFIDSSYRNIIENNTLIKNFMGFFLGMGILNIIKHNKIINNDIGIFLAVAIQNKILGNEISNNKFGIILLESMFNEIEYNNISNNKIIGLMMRRFSIGNQIQYNNFIKNLISVNSKRCLKNNWNYNYWDRFRLLPKPIFGRLGKLGLIPWINFDWHPAKEPYDTPYD